MMDPNAMTMVKADIPQNAGLQAPVGGSGELIDELRTLIADLGKDGGVISPSVYDTAQVLRFYPSAEGIEPVLEWLLSQQKADGGWGNPAFPLTRDVPTLAAILAVSAHVEHWQTYPAVTSGIRFLEGQAPLWSDTLPDDIPVGAELIIPKLLSDADDMRLSLPCNIYESVCELGERRLQLISSLQPKAGTTASFSWEAWGEESDPVFLDELGSVGHSPSATAAWLQLARNVHGLDVERQAAEEYLRNASRATQSGIPGLYPTAWPIDRFEQVFGLYALLVTDLLFRSDLRSAIEPKLDLVRGAMTPKGIGFTDYFEPDGDNTAAAVAVLEAAGVAGVLSALDPYEREGHFSSYPYELQPSLSATARAVHAYRLGNVSIEKWMPAITALQSIDGRWIGDKWNVSWIYTTVHMIFACDLETSHKLLINAKRALLESQCADGGWQIAGQQSQFETALAVMGLHAACPSGSDNDVMVALNRADRWLDRRAQDGQAVSATSWLNKELYRVPRIEKVFVTAARQLLSERFQIVDVRDPSAAVCRVDEPESECSITEADAAV